MPVITREAPEWILEGCWQLMTKADHVWTQQAVEILGIHEGLSEHDEVDLIDPDGFPEVEAGRVTKLLSILFGPQWRVPSKFL